MKGIHDEKSITESLDEFFTREYGKEYTNIRERSSRLSISNRGTNTRQQTGRTTKTKSGKEITKGENIILEKDQKGEKIREIIGNENADIINKAIDLDQRYRNGYLERRANKAGKDLKLDKKGLNNGQVREISEISKERGVEFQRNSGQSGIISKVDRRQKVSKKLDENSKETPSNEQQNKPRLGIRQNENGLQSAHYTPDGSYYSLKRDLNNAKPFFRTEGQKDRRYNK